VLYAVTKLNSVDVRSLCSYTVCGCMSLSSVVCVCVCVCVCVPGVPVLVKSGHRVYDSMTRFHQDTNSRRTHTTDDNDIQPHTV